MTCRRSRGRLLASAVSPIALSLLSLAPAMAQPAGTIEEVVVTAEKRAENIQNVPIAITAFTAADLQQKGVVDLHGLSNLTPNVTLDAGSPFSGDSSVLSASIRGIGQDDFAFNLDPGVGVYVDGVYLGRTIGANVDLLDVDRVEVLKGPQGTLFGRNTIGGAINIVTRTPGDQFFVEGQVTTGSFNRRDVALSADVPLTPNLLTSLTFSSVEQDGYQHQIPYKNTNNYTFDPISPDSGGMDTNNESGGQNHQAVRGKAIWTPTADFTATVSADWTHENQESVPNTVLQSFPNTPGSFPIAGTPYTGSIALLYTLCNEGVPIGVLCNTPRATGWPPGPNGLPPLSSLHNLMPISPQTTQTGNIDTTYANGPNYAKYDAEGGSVTLAWALDPDLTLKSITGYRHITWNIGIDLDGSPDHGELLTVTDKQRQQQVTQEIQAVGTAMDSRLNYVAGLYYFYEDGFVHDWVPFDGSLLAVQDSNLNDLKTSSYAAYAHADYKLTDELAITLGARYSIDHKEFLGGQQDLDGLSYKASGCYPPTDPAYLHLDPTIPPFITCQQALGFSVPGQPFRYFPAGWNSRNFYEFTPTAGAQYHFTPDLMGYVSWSKGFKSGGWTTRLSDPISDARAAEFGPEKAETYEIGFKSTWLDNRLLLNGAGFYTDYRQIQLNQQVGASPVLKNLGNANIWGAELEGQAILGGGFSVHGSLGYIDAYYTSLDPSVVSVVPLSSITLNSKLPKTPKWKININPDYSVDLGGGMALDAQLSYTYTASMYNDSLNTPLLKRPALNLLDAFVQFSFGDGRYSLTAGGTNITDRRYITIGSVNYAAGFVDATYDPPAEWYLTLRAKI